MYRSIDTILLYRWMNKIVFACMHPSIERYNAFVSIDENNNVFMH